MKNYGNSFFIAMIWFCLYERHIYSKSASWVLITTDHQVAVKIEVELSSVKAAPPCWTYIVPLGMALVLVTACSVTQLVHTGIVASY